MAGPAIPHLLQIYSEGEAQATVAELTHRLIEFRIDAILSTRREEFLQQQISVRCTNH